MKMFSRYIVGTALTACLLLWAAMPITGQSGAKNGEWRTYGGDLGNTHYSPLDQINADNFYKLQVAWRFKTDNLGPGPEFNLESTPLMANGVVYSTAGTRRAVVAMDAATGELMWTHGEREGPRGEAAPRLLSGRGLAYWSDGREQRILYVTPGYRLIALDAKTGNVIWGPERTAEGTVNASPLLADGKLYITGDNGVTTVLAAGPQFKVLATNELDGGYTLASLAVSGSRIFLRSGTELYCIGK